MRFDDLSDTEHLAVAAAMRYWIEHWDFECPTLFGLEEDELRKVAERWPRIESGQERTSALAINGSLRELLYGASALDPARIPEVCGLTYEQADVLSSKVFERVRHTL